MSKITVPPVWLLFRLPNANAAPHGVSARDLSTQYAFTLEVSRPSFFPTYLSRCLPVRPSLYPTVEL